MDLPDLQLALGRLIRAPTREDPLGGLRLDTAERARLAALADSPGFRCTVKAQRSWCAGRAAKSAQLTLSLRPAEERQRLLDDWVNSGGGTPSFFTAEAAAFLEFLAERLPCPSHALTVCRVEQATLRARDGAIRFAVPDRSWLDAPDRVLRAGRYAALVPFHAAPHLLLAALEGQPLPPISPTITPVLFGPGLPGLSRLATGEEMALWERLRAPQALSALWREGHPREAIATLVMAGVAECGE